MSDSAKEKKDLVGGNTELLLKGWQTAATLGAHGIQRS
tara:strand:- start:6649 stop:6762 length:114 start_codon:yes stop_codon:yes gene_type:complete